MITGVEQRQVLDGCRIRKQCLGERHHWAVGIGKPRNHSRHPRQMRIRQTDPEIETERLRDLFAEERTERATGYASDQFADNPAERHHVIAVARTRLPEWLFRGESFNHVIPVAITSVLDGLAQRRQTDGMIQHHLDGRVLFAIGREFGPVLCNRRMQIQITAIDQHVRAQSSRGLGARKYQRDRVVRPRAAPSSVDTRPPHKSTTVSPPTLTHTDAPTSSRFAKFSMKASPTLENSGAQRPDTRPRPTSTSINTANSPLIFAPCCVVEARYGKTAVT